MGSGGAKEGNKMLAEQTARSRGIGDVAGARGAEQYGQVSGLPGEILGKYRDIYGGIGEGGGGGGGLGPRYSPADFESEALPFYMKMMQEGGYSEADKANILSYATGPISGMFEGMKRNLSTMGAGRGMPGYGGDFSRLASDQAYASGEMAKGVAGDLAERVLGSRFRGAGGVTGIESEKRSFESSERARQLSAARSRAGAGRAREGDEFRRRMAVLDAMGGYRPGSDIEYMDRELGATGLGTGTIAARADETPMWQKALASVIPAGAGAALGSFTGGGGGGMPMPKPGSPALTPKYGW